MKKLILTSLTTAILIGAAWQVHAMAEGFYIGIMLGPATSNGKIINAQVPDGVILNPDGTVCVNSKNSFCVTSVQPRSQQFTTRIYMGNQFNQYAAIEFGLDFFAQVHYNFIGVQTTTTPSQRVRGIDIVGKGIWPLGAFSVFVKGGIAATYITTSTELNPAFKVTNPFVPTQFCSQDSNPPTDPNCAVVLGQNGHRNKFSGTAGFGFSYDINQSWQTDLSANALFVGGSIGRVTAYSIGISYHFVNKYCGQFLCDD